MTKRRRFGLAGWCGLLTISSLLGAALSSAQETATPVQISAPEQAVVGGEVEIRWQGEPGHEGDFISIDPDDAPEREYGKYIYAKDKQSGTLRVPETPGRYRVRYHAGDTGYAVRGQAPIEVVDTTATLEVPPAVDSGGMLEVAWTGPGHRGDFISIDPLGSEERAYGPYAYAKKNPAMIRAPEEPGPYEVRYHLSQTYRVIGKAALTVGSVTASVTAPEQVQAGGKVSVHWEGPDGQGDYISIDPFDAPDRDYLQYAYTKTGNPVTIQVPEEIGRYEIRYHQGQKRTVLARIPLEVAANQATISGPQSVAGGAEFSVQWTGPENAADYVTIVPAGAPARDYLAYHYTKQGSPGTLVAPLEPGAYELRYVTGLSRGVLARVAIEVTPGAIPGSLRVVADDGVGSGGTHTGSAINGTVEVILDASGSMLKRLGGERRIEIAKGALDELVRTVVPAGTPFALRVFGHREADSCRTDLEIPVGPLDAGAVSSKIRNVQAKNLAKTPIAASLAKVQADLAGVEGPVTVVLLTDGEETCDGDPRAAIETLQAAGIDVRVNIVGFAINELALKEQFEAWARVGNGRYIEAHDKDELRAAMSQSLDVPFEVLADGEVVATGVVNGEAVQLLPGAYQVRVLGSGPRDLGDVTIEARTEVDLRADGTR